MSKGKRVPMNHTAQRRIQGAVDRKPNPSPRQQAFKARTASVMARKTAK